MPQDNTIKKQRAKKSTASWNTPTPVDHFGLPLAERMLNVTQLCLDGMNWARFCPSAIKMKQFFNLKGLEKYQWDNLVATNEEVKRANSFMLTELGNRREYMALIKRFDVGFVKESIHTFDTDWMEINKYHKQNTIDIKTAAALAVLETAEKDKNIELHLHTSA